MPHLAGLAFPSTGHPAPIRALTILGSLVATPARRSLSNDVVFESGIPHVPSITWLNSACLLQDPQWSMGTFDLRSIRE